MEGENQLLKLSLMHMIPQMHRNKSEDPRHILVRNLAPESLLHTLVSMGVFRGREEGKATTHGWRERLLSSELDGVVRRCFQSNGLKTVWCLENLLQT